MAEKYRQLDVPIGWERVRAIFGNANPPAQVWERQFDYNDDDLKRLAATPYREINRNDLWYYFHDLAWVELQPDLFDYLFPVCLMQWHDTLMRDEACSQGDSEFHSGMCRGQVFQKMLTPRQQAEVIDFFRDSFLQRLDAEPVAAQPSLVTHPYGWICRFNSLGLVAPRMDAIWEPWWRVETRGRAIAVLKYCSGLAYFEGENKLFGIETKHHGWIGPNLWENDSYLHDQGWLEPNLSFLRKVLSYDYLLNKVQEATDRLSNDPEHGLAEKLVADVVINRELVECRVAELPRLLAGKRTTAIEGWSI